MDQAAINCEAKRATLSCGDDDGRHDAFHIDALTLSCCDKLADANSSNSCGFMALDIPYDRPQLGKIDREISALLRAAGAVTSQELTNRRINRDDDDYVGGLWSSDLRTGSSMIGSKSSLLLIAMLLVAITYQLPFRILGNASREGRAHNSIFGLNGQDSIMWSLIVLFNSIVFVASVVTTIFLQHELPMKPLPQLSVSALFGSYMCLMKAT